ncbi:GSCOCG00004330001-RA-CDS [Cotesia congregata]|nr:GSCOCG00004330001-RA-CDS [Cotesia congregata]
MSMTRNLNLKKRKKLNDLLLYRWALSNSQTKKCMLVISIKQRLPGITVEDG